MDRVYISDDFAVRAVEHGYADALSAGSDHAFVCAEMEFDLVRFVTWNMNALVEV
jgi:endonuclease/exonuclease/phosphatase family metal-dependent hydrolase